MRRHRIPLAVLIALVVSALPAQPQLPRPLPSLREQAEIQQKWLQLRLDRHLPELMRREQAAMWVIPMREYNEDPVFSSLVAPTTFAARRRTIFVFFDRGADKGIERLALGGSSQGGVYEALRDTTRVNAELWGRAQWDLLRRVIEARDPSTIAVNISHTHAFSDGLSAGEWEQLQESLGERYRSRVVRKDRLALDLIALRIEEMEPVYRGLMQTAHQIIATAFSSAVITPGKTTTDDVVWWMRQTTHDLGLGTWFQPSVDIQRPGQKVSDQAPTVIERGDVLHCDFGVVGMGLHTDTQHMAYVLRAGERAAPAGLVAALRKGQQLQEIVLKEISAGGTGNEVLRRSLAAMRLAGIDGTVYSHPVGEHGHGAGPLIGLWDRQEGVPGRGDLPVDPMTWYSIELQATSPVPEWGGQKVRMALEEDVMLDSHGVATWVNGRQESFLLVN
ncbi:MAG: aminopeptidase P family protein [Bacteroidetes bacterium]|jgi:hypothetical protein|nr:aminopeptidase P family protein [Bacteroidota bacterium]